MDPKQLATCDENILSSSEEIAPWAGHHWKGELVVPYHVISVTRGSKGSVVVKEKERS